MFKTPDGPVSEGYAENIEQLSSKDVRRYFMGNMNNFEQKVKGQSWHLVKNICFHFVQQTGVFGYVCLFWFNVAFKKILSHITTVSGCDRELNAHFYSAVSLKSHDPDTWHDTTHSHIILTLGQPVLALPRKSESKC